MNILTEILELLDKQKTISKLNRGSIDAIITNIDLLDKHEIKELLEDLKQRV